MEDIECCLFYNWATYYFGVFLYKVSIYIFENPTHIATIKKQGFISFSKSRSFILLAIFFLAMIYWRLGAAVLQGVHKARIRVQARSLHLVATKEATNQVRSRFFSIHRLCDKWQHSTVNPVTLDLHESTFLILYYTMADCYLTSFTFREHQPGTGMESHWRRPAARSQILLQRAMPCFATFFKNTW